MSLFSRIFRDQTQSTNVQTITNGLTDDLDYLCAKLSTWALVQHKEDGTHNFIETGYDLVPIGGMIRWGGTATLPTRWISCDGRALNRAAYPLLFKAIGITNGAGDGVNTFNVPNVANFMILADR